MSNRSLVGIAALTAVATSLAYVTTRPDGADETTAQMQRMRPAIRAPKDIVENTRNQKVKIKGEGTIRYTSESPSAIHLADVPKAPSTSAEDLPTRGGRRVESRFTDQQIADAQAAAAAQPTSSAIQNLDGSQKPVGQKPKGGVKFNAIDASDCCTGTRFSATVPPDPDIAAGPNHLIVVVNTAFEVFDKSGNSLTGPIQFATFFDPTQGGSNPGAGTPTPGCTAFTFQAGLQRGAVFDPDVVYDAAANRFVIGVDGNGTDYCVAATQTGDPTGAWNRFGFPTDVNGAFFDFPHMGVGENEIIMGSNQFGGTLPFGFEGRVFAMKKADLYTGTPLNIMTRPVKPASLPVNVKLDGTPQPAQSPTGAANYIMTEFFDGRVHSVYSWVDPFGANVFDIVGDVDLAMASGVPCEGFSCFPISWPQKGSVEILAGNDFRGQETKVSNGYLWTTQTISCNPGKGTRNCVRWAQIDPAAVVPAPDQTAFPLAAGTNGVIQAGVIGSDWDYRSFPSIAANTCNDMAVGYSYSKAPGNSGGTWYPSLFVAGRSASDPLGRVGGESLLKKGTAAYVSFQDNGGVDSVRWGDYSGMALDPDGKTFWYAGEYAAGKPSISVVSGNVLANWGTFVGAFTIRGC